MHRSAFGGFAQLDQRKRRMETRLALCGPHWGISCSLPMLLETLQTTQPPRSCRGSAEVFTGHVMQTAEVYARSYHRAATLAAWQDTIPQNHSSCLFLLLPPHCGQLLISGQDSALGLQHFHNFLPTFQMNLIIPPIVEVRLCSLDNNR